jgi:uncharacterized membrane protein
MKKINLIFAIILSLFFLIGIFSFHYLPEQMASHWNAAGEVNDYMSKFWGVFLLPIITIAITFLLLFVPKLDPLKENINLFRKEYEQFVLVTIIFLLVIYSWTLLWNFGVQIGSNLIIPLGMGILFYFIARLLPKTKCNHFIGIRTAWTLSSDKVWEKTHQLGGKLFKVAGIIAIIGVLFPSYSWLFILIPIISASIFLIIYSYWCSLSE